MAVDPFENWIAVGTSLGYHVIWDMRFQLPIRKWQHTGHGGKRKYNSNYKSTHFSQYIPFNNRSQNLGNPMPGHPWLNMYQIDWEIFDVKVFVDGASI